MLFRLDEVHKSYGAQEVLRGVTFQINPGERVGLVGRNGAGKTTIFRLVTGLEEPDNGRVTLLRNLRLGMLDQQPQFSGHTSVVGEALSVFAELRAIEAEISRIEHLMAEATGTALEDAMHVYSDLRHRYEIDGGFTYRARAESVLAGLGFDKGDLTKPADELSGGQKARLALAKLLLAEPDLLLLDEPTNHLDVNAVEWLEDFLAGFKSAFVIISHDRFLLDRTATKIIEVDSGRAAVYPGNYTAYVRQREERRLAQTRQYEQQQEMIARTEEFIRRNLAGQKTKQAKSRRNKLERLERVEAAREERTGSFRFQNIARAGDNVLAVAGLSVGYDTVLASGIEFLLKRGERLGIIGPNGSGKTTFLRTIVGDIEPLADGLTWGANVNVAYFDQELATLDPGNNVIEEIRAIAPRVPDGELRGYLARFLFTGDDITKPVAALSGGEQSRLALAKLIYSQANVLLLDEPTNHLDIPGREALERALAEYTGTIIAVSHDRYFLDKIATEILHFELGAATYHYGSYSDYYALRHQAQTETQEPAERRRVTNKRAPQKRPRIGKQRRERGVEEIEQEIHSVEGELNELAEKLASPAPGWGREQYAEIGARQQVLSSQLERLYEEWEAVAAGSESQS
ncbi:MAG TPA: ABC-F family ATP-binding cassette domain-containing protein [Blastocatellia bacterium]|nr:ABC-F family ATP-binding cassette domain-containing protein [Blastocatellia bacterium]